MRISLRWRLILVSWSLAFGTALALTLLSQAHTRRELLEQLESTLETKCDEVITVLESGTLPTLEEFLVVETHYRFSPYRYFYQVSEAGGRLLVRSTNLGEAQLPIPAEAGTRVSGRHHLQTLSHPLSPAADRIRLRSERVEVQMGRGGVQEVIIQTAVSLAPFEVSLAQTRSTTYRVAVTGLAAVLFLLWFVTTRALRPVAAMTTKASQITAANLRERLPSAGGDDELDRLAGVLNDMLDRLAGSLGQMEQFSADAAHQLRTPLTRIRGELDLILRGDVADPLRGDLERIQEELDRLSRLCGRLLLFARLDRQGGGPTVLDEIVVLGPLVTDLIEQVTPAADERGVALSKGETPAVRVRGSRALLVEAVLNLLDNAVRVTSPGGAVCLSIDTWDDTARICVADGGPGVPSEERERIFLPFHRLPSDGSAAEDGSGLGLAIARAIARAHGGRVDIDCPPQGGSTFRLVLPVLA